MRGDGEMKKNSQSSKASLDKCHLRWFLLFDKIMKILWERDPSLVKTVRYNLFKFGLGDKVFQIEPTEEVLEKIKAFHDGKLFPLKLKGKQKRDGKVRYQRIMILHDYLEILSVLESLPRTFRNPDARMLSLKERLRGIERWIISPNKDKIVPDNLLQRRFAKKELAIRLTCFFYHRRSSSIRGALTHMRKIFPECFMLGYEQGSIDLEGIAKNIKSGVSTIGLFDDPSILRWINTEIEREAFKGFPPK